MQDKMSQEIVDRLKLLETAIQRDSEALKSSPVFSDVQAVFDELFDAVHFTLQNESDSAADEAV